MVQEKIKCLICGKDFIKPLAHAWQKHQISAKEYKKTFGLDSKKGLITSEHKAHLAQKVQDNYDKVVSLNLLKRGQVTRFRKGDRNIGTYERSEETMTRLKKHWKKVANLKGRALSVKKITINCAICGKSKEIYPRYYKKNNNYCGVTCRNIANNNKK